MADENLLSTIFWGNDPNVNQQLRQRIALAMMMQKRAYPKNIGEGLSAIGESLGEIGTARRLERESAAAEDVGKKVYGDRPSAAGEGKRSDAETEQPAQQVAAVSPVVAPPPPPPPAAVARPPEVAARPPDEAPLPFQQSYITQPPASPPPPAPVAAPPQAAASPMQAALQAHGARRSIDLPPISGDSQAARFAGSFDPFQQAPGFKPGQTGSRLAYGPADAAADARVSDVVGLGGGPTGAYSYPRTASAREGNIQSDVPPVTGISPSTGAAAADTMQQRDDMARTMMLQNQPPARAVPPPNPTLPGAPPPVSGALPGGDQRLAQATPPGVVSDVRAAPQVPQVRPMPPPVAQGPPADPGYVTTVGPRPVAPGAERMSPDELYAIDMKRKYRGNDAVQQNMDVIIGQEQTRRAYIDARNNKAYDAEIASYEAMKKLAEEQKATSARRQLEYGKEQSEAQVKAEEAATIKRTGMVPTEFYKRLDVDKHGIDQTVRAQDAQRLARNAIKAGVITGYGANMQVSGAKFADWAWSNGLKGDLAANTEIMKASLDAGLSEAIKTVNGEGGVGVSNTDVRIAQGIQGSDPNLQMKTIQTIMDRAAEINHMKINRYEEQVDKYLGGHPQELRYTTNARPTAPADHLKLLIDSQQDPDKASSTKAYFDKTYGPGAADLELGRFERAQRRQRRE
jgi:hypothetical protein